MVRFTDPDEDCQDIDENEDQFDDTESEQDHADDPEQMEALKQLQSLAPKNSDKKSARKGASRQQQ